MIKEVVKTINAEISAQIYNVGSDFHLTYSTTGLYCNITFLGIRVWDSYNSVCYYNNEFPDAFESIEQCVRRRVNTIILNIKGISL
jgi:hypothetical protein